MGAIDVLVILNENPQRFLSGRHQINIRGQECLISRNNLKGGVIVSFVGQSFEFFWDKEKWTQKV